MLELELHEVVGGRLRLDYGLTERADALRAATSGAVTDVREGEVLTGSVRLLGPANAKLTKRLLAVAARFLSFEEGKSGRAILADLCGVSCIRCVCC